MYIERLKFENLRTFEHAEIEWNYPGRPLGPVEFDNVNLLLGDNASGKTTVLKAVALGTLAPIFGSSSGFVPYFLVRRSSGASGDASVTSSVLIEQDDADGNESGSECTLVLGRNRGGDTDRVLAVDEEAEDSTFRLSDALWEAERSGYFVVGYGANRRVEPESVAFNEESRSKSRFLRYQRVAGLFEESVTLVPLTAWLPLLRERDSKRYKQVKDLLRSLLEPHADIADIPNSRDILIRMNREAVPSSALSDGYRAFLGWTSDLLYHLIAATPDDRALRDQSGIVLVDEIDLHLHPEWQQRVIPTVARAFPNLQFIFTSHSPLVVGSLRQANVFVLERDERGVSQIKRSPSEVYGLSADQILTSQHFGLRSTRAERFVEELEKKAVEAREGNADAAIEFLDMVTLGAAADPEKLGPSSTS